MTDDLLEAARDLAGREAAYREAYHICGPTSDEAARRRKQLAESGHRVRSALDKETAR